MGTDNCGQNPCLLCRHCLPGLEKKLVAQRRVFSYKKGQSIFREGEKIEGIFFISDGAVKVHQSWGAGKEFILRFSSKGDVVGYRARIENTHSPISATVLAATTACFIPGEFLESVFRTTPSFLYAMMQLYATELQKAESRMRDLAIVPVKGRVAQALFTIREVFGTDERGYIRIPVTRLDIACHAGTTYEGVFRLLTDWSREGLISTAGKKIRINEDDPLRGFIRIG